MNKKELFTDLCDIVAIFDRATQRLVDKNDHDLLMLFYKTGNCVFDGQQDVFFKKGYGDILEIAALFGADAIREDLQPKMPANLLERHKDEDLKLSPEEKKKFELREEDISDRHIAELEKIVFASEDDIVAILEAIRDGGKESLIEDSGKYGLIDLYEDFVDGEEIDIESLPIDELHYLVFDIGTNNYLI